MPPKNFMSMSDKAQNRIERILDAALQVFSDKGYKDAAVDDIAAVSDTSKGGVYFHFPNKKTIFLSLLDKMADLLYSRAEEAMAKEPDMRRKGDAALLVMLRTFAKHRAMSKLFLVEALGAGREFNDKMLDINFRFAGLITRHLNELVALGMIEPIDTEIAGVAWFGGVNEIVRRWVLTGKPEKLEDAYPALRDLLRRSIGQF